MLFRLGPPLGGRFGWRVDVGEHDEVGLFPAGAPDQVDDGSGDALAGDEDDLDRQTDRSRPGL